MGTKISQSIGFKILFFYMLLALVNISFVVSIIFESQVDLISKNIKFESERQLAKLVSSMKKFTSETRRGALFDLKNNREVLDQITKFIGPHFEGYLIFAEKGAIVYKSSAGMKPPGTYIEDGLRSITAKAFSGNEYYLRIDEEKKMMYCYISLNEFNLGNSILLLQKDISGLNESLASLYRQAIYVILVVLLFHGIFAIILFRYIIHPINLLKNGVEMLSKDSSARISVDRKDEFRTLAEAFNSMARTIDNKMTTLSGRMEMAEESKERAVNLSIKDELTGLFNRSYMIERFNEELKWARLKKKDIAFLLLDLDSFNEINKIYGQQTGNIVLMEASKSIVRTCADTDIVGRFEGDVFAILSLESSSKQAAQLAEEIRSAIEKSAIITPDGKFSITASIGIVCISAGRLKENESYQDYLKTADTALLRAKENGKNRAEMIT